MDGEKAKESNNVLTLVNENPENSIEFDGLIDLENVMNIEKEGFTGMYNIFFG